MGTEVDVLATVPRADDRMDGPGKGRGRRALCRDCSTLSTLGAPRLPPEGDGGCHSVGPGSSSIAAWPRAESQRLGLLHMVERRAGTELLLASAREPFERCGGVDELGPGRRLGRLGAVDDRGRCRMCRPRPVGVPDVVVRRGVMAFEPYLWDDASTVPSRSDPHWRSDGSRELQLDAQHRVDVLEEDRSMRGQQATEPGAFVGGPGATWRRPVRDHAELRPQRIEVGGRSDAAQSSSRPGALTSSR